MQVDCQDFFIHKLDARSCFNNLHLVYKYQVDFLENQHNSYLQMAT